MSTAKNHLRRAFSLIELLVVVSIIALLIAILMPALAKAKAQADAVACGSNVKALMLGMSTYLSANDGTFPVNGILFPKFNSCNNPNVGNPEGIVDSKGVLINTGETNTDNYRVENGVLYSEVNSNKKIYMCPTDFKAGCQRTYIPQKVGDTTVPLLMDMTPAGLVTNPRDPTGPKVPHIYYAGLTNGVLSTLNPATGAAGQGYWSYSVNAVLNSASAFSRTTPDSFGNAPYFTTLPWANPLKVVNVKNPMFVTFVEECGTGQYASPFNDEVMDSPAYNAGDSLTDRHNFGGNVAFLDGHVEYFKQSPFDYVPTATGTNANQNALASDITKMFFPDAGAFVNSP